MSPTRSARRLALVALVSLCSAATAQAQNNATANITAAVQQPITVTKNNDLAFGNVFPGVDKTIAVTAAGAAKFTVAGQAATPVQLTFSLPGTLTNGGNNLVIDTWTGHHNTVDLATGGTSFTPSSSATTATLSAVGGNLFVYVGATVRPTTSQAAGNYTGSFTMTAVYF
ncbi:MAG TPA: DUF4402 domain-containing protein [Gemmatimonadales bacterium]|nr:DUF4402 domain-containing protein [Gemmatimonadales bacterium]